MNKRTLPSVMVTAFTLLATLAFTTAVAGASTATPLSAVPARVSASANTSFGSVSPASSSATKVCTTLDPQIWASIGLPAYFTDIKEALADGCAAYVSTDIQEGDDSPSALYAEFLRGPKTGCSGMCVGAAVPIAYVYTTSGVPVQVTDLALTSSGVLYAVDYTSDFYKINTETAVATLIGPVNSVVNGLVVGPTGTVYASGSGALYKINTKTGAGTLLGSNSYVSSGDIAFAHCGCMYMTASGSPDDEFVHLNPSNGAATLVGSTGQADVYGLVSSYGTLYATSLGGYLMKINPTTGAATLISFNNLAASGMASPPNHT